MRSGVYLQHVRVNVEVMRVCVTYGVGHDSQVPQILAVMVLEHVVETVRAAVCAGMPGRGLPDTMEQGEGEGLVEDDEGVAGLPEGVEEGDLPGRDGIRGSRGGHEERSGCCVRRDLHASRLDR